MKSTKSNLAQRRAGAILIVDDAPANLAMLREMLMQQGYQTFVATSGAQALKIAARVVPDLILLDIIMGDMDGFETCRRLKREPGTSRIPVIFMSASTATEDIVAGFDIGAADYLSKPFRMGEVFARVRTQLQLHSNSETEQEQAERLRNIVSKMGGGLLIIEADGRIQFTNPACDQYLGYRENELAGYSLKQLLSPLVAQDYLDYFADYNAAPETARNPGTREVAIKHRDGHAVSMDLTLTPMNSHQPLYIGVLHDITHHKQSENALQRAALIDPLTKLANRRHFDTFLEREWQRSVRSGKPLSMLLLDVDHFKLYNDSLGHPAGDACLQLVAQAIQSHAGRPTDLAARYGGEEFVLLYAETDSTNALLLAEEIRAHIEALRLPHPRSVTLPWITVSVGVATIEPRQYDDRQALLIAADRAMYVAKESGRNQVQSSALV